MFKDEQGESKGLSRAHPPLSLWVVFDLESIRKRKEKKEKEEERNPPSLPNPKPYIHCRVDPPTQALGECLFCPLA